MVKPGAGVYVSSPAISSSKKPPSFHADFLCPKLHKSLLAVTNSFTMTTTLNFWPKHTISLKSDQWAAHFGAIEDAYEAVKSADPNSNDFDSISKSFDAAVYDSKPLSSAVEGRDYRVLASIDLEGNLRVFQCQWETETHALLGCWELKQSPTV